MQDWEQSSAPLRGRKLTEDEVEFEAREMEELAAKETQWVRCSKIIVVLVLCIATAVTAFVTHSYTSQDAMHVWVAAVRIKIGKFVRTYTSITATQTHTCSSFLSFQSSRRL